MASDKVNSMYILGLFKAAAAKLSRLLSPPEIVEILESRQPASLICCAISSILDDLWAPLNCFSLRAAVKVRCSPTVSDVKNKSFWWTNPKSLNPLSVGSWGQPARTTKSTFPVDEHWKAGLNAIVAKVTSLFSFKAQFSSLACSFFNKTFLCWALPPALILLKKHVQEQ